MVSAQQPHVRPPTSPRNPLNKLFSTFRHTQRANRLAVLPAVANCSHTYEGGQSHRLKSRACQSTIHELDAGPAGAPTARHTEPCRPGLTPSPRRLNGMRPSPCAHVQNGRSSPQKGRLEIDTLFIWNSGPSSSAHYLLLVYAAFAPTSLYAPRFPTFGLLAGVSPQWRDVEEPLAPAAVEASCIGWSHRTNRACDLKPAPPVASPRR